MRAAAIFFFARVIRAAIAVSLTRNARATSAVRRPHTSRSVSAICEEGASAGWQQVKISRRRSSGDVVGLLVGERRLDEQRERAREGRVAPAQVERAPPRDGRQPRARVLRHAGALPAAQRALVGVLHALLGDVEVARDAHRRGEHEGPLATVRGGDRGGRLHAQSNTMIGRTSTPPATTGICLATAIAASRSAASIR